MQDARDPTDNPSRRRLITGSALLAGATLATRATASPAAGDDAEILRLFAEWLPLHRRDRFLDNHTAEMRDIPAEIAHEESRLVTATLSLTEKIADLRATTLEGLRAKATVLLSYSGYQADGESPLWNNYDELMGWSIARDLLGDAAATAEFVA